VATVLPRRHRPPVTVRARKFGFEPVERRVDITADTTVDFTLVKAN
jgi:hypothetical protein